MSGYHDLTRRVQDGQPVDAGSVNSPLSDLDDNIRYLRELLDALNVGSAIYARNVTVEEGALVGMPVYYNATTQRYERALAATVTDNTTGELLTAPSASVWGIVCIKTNTTLADLVIGGLAEIDLTNSTGGNAAGRYYLSASTPGHMSLQQPPVTVPVVLANGQGQVLVLPQQLELLESHKHYKFSLKCLPAGTHVPPSVGERHTITSPNTAIEGWLPASSFTNAPEGAVFGYNLAASPLLRVWPPVPLQSVYLEWDKVASWDVLGTGVPLGPEGLALLDANGIWWMSDCYYDVPWPPTLDTTDPDNTSFTPNECPRDAQMRLTLYFTRMVFQTAGSAVTSLNVAAGSGLSLTCVETGDPADTGNLLLNLDLGFSQGADTADGHLVFKELVGNVFQRGPVVEALVAGTNISLTSTAPDGSNHQGIVTISANNTVTGNELPVELVRLSGVEESNYQDVMGLSFVASRIASYRGRIRIPASLVGSTSCRLRLRILGRASGTLPNLTLTTRILTRPTAVLTNQVSLPTSDSSLGLTTNATVTANSYVEALSSPLTVHAGDVVLFTLSRATVDAYAGDVQVIDQVGVLGL